MKKALKYHNYCALFKVGSRLSNFEDNSGKTFNKNILPYIIHLKVKYKMWLILGVALFCFHAQEVLVSAGNKGHIACR